VLLLTCSIAIFLDVIVQQFKESPGPYYDYIAEAYLYSTEWKVVTYINLEADDNFRTASFYAQMTADCCKRLEHKFGANYTGHLNIKIQTDRPMKGVNDLRLIFRQLTSLKMSQFTLAINEMYSISLEEKVKFCFELWIMKTLIIIPTKFHIWKTSSSIF